VLKKGLRPGTSKTYTWKVSPGKLEILPDFYLNVRMKRIR